MVFFVGIAAAFSLGLGYVLQQRVAAQAPLSQMLTVRLLLDLMRKPKWWAGIGAMVVGQILGGLALRMATVALVEPLLSTSLLFALGFSAYLSARRGLRWQEVVGALLLSGSLAAFLLVGDPRSTDAPMPPTPIIVLTLSVFAGAILLLVILAKGQDLIHESILLATGAGLLYGLQDASTRASFVIADHHGIREMFFHPWFYILVGAAAVGILLSQSAFKAARLDYSLPPITAAEPIAGIALGVTLLGDELLFSPVGLAVEALCIVGVVAGVVLIGRSPTLSDCAPTAPPAPTALEAEAPNEEAA